MLVNVATGTLAHKSLIMSSNTILSNVMRLLVCFDFFAIERPKKLKID